MNSAFVPLVSTERPGAHVNLVELIAPLVLTQLAIAPHVTQLSLTTLEAQVCVVVILLKVRLTTVHFVIRLELVQMDTIILTMAQILVKNALQLIVPDVILMVIAQIVTLLSYLTLLLRLMQRMPVYAQLVSTKCFPDCVIGAQRTVQPAPTLLDRVAPAVTPLLVRLLVVPAYVQALPLLLLGASAMR